MNDGDYVLGTRDDEVERLGIQHRVWRERVLDAFHRAGIGPGQTVVDVGAGPGFVTMDLAELVGSFGKVIALERAPHFLATLHTRGLANVDVRDHDVSRPFDLSGVSASWCRWVLSFVPEGEAVVSNIADALRPGGVAIFHEYACYATWRCMPPKPLHDRFRNLVEQSWRDSGGEPDVALWLPTWLAAAGLEIVSTRLLAEVITPRDETWAWPRTFVESGAQRLHELGYVDSEEAEAIARLLVDAPEGARMITPLVAEIIARKA